MIGGKVSLENISVSPFKNFPYLSIALQNISVTDSLFEKHQHKFFSAEKVFVRVNPFALLIARVSLNKLEITNGSLYLFTDTSGYSTGYLLNGKKTENKPSSDGATKNLLEKIEVNKFLVTIEDLQKDKLFDFVVNHLEAKTKTTDTSSVSDIKESILVKSLAFKLNKGTYLANQTLEGSYTLQYLPTKKSLLFNDIEMAINKQPFRFTGAMIFGTVQEFSILATSKNLYVDAAKKILTAPIAHAVSLVSVEKPLDVSASITGSLNGGDPLVKVNWATKNNSITTPLLNFTNCSFTGLYTNEVTPGKERTDPNSKVEVHQFSGNWQGLTMTSKDIIITDLTTPTIKADIRSSFALTELNSLLQTDAIALTSGTGLLLLNYTGPIEHISPLNTKLSGSLFIDGGTIHTTAGNADLTRCRGNIRFLNQDIIVDSLFGRLTNNPFRMWGTAKNVFSLVGDSKDPVSLSWNLYAPVLNINNISSIFLRKLPNKTQSKTNKNTSLAKTAQQLDNLLSSGNISVSVRADKILFHRFEGTKLQADLSVSANMWTLKKASLINGKGSFLLSAKVLEEQGNRFKLISDLHMKEVDAKKTFYSFENFGIKDISYKNIEGVLTANANVSVNLDKAGNFDMGSMAGDADFSIVNGALIKFAPVMKIQEFAFKNRDFSDIRFAEIKDKLRFNKGVIEMDRMEINSTVLSLYVEGVYALRGITDISIQVPLKNLKKRDKDYKPENSGGDSRGGMSVFLRAKTAEDGTIKIKYDLFKRFRKT